MASIYIQVQNLASVDVHSPKTASNPMLRGFQENIGQMSDAPQMVCVCKQVGVGSPDVLVGWTFQHKVHQILSWCVVRARQA